MLLIVSRTFMAVIFIVAGTLHFLNPAPFVRIMPPFLPAPGALVAISGAAEILGGLGLLLRPVRRAAAWGLVLLLIAVLPANVYMAVAHVPFDGIAGESWAQWLRVPMQIPLIWWAWLYTRREKAWVK